jgi:hypothetical protein
MERSQIALDAGCVRDFARERFRNASIEARLE